MKPSPVYLTELKTTHLEDQVYMQIDKLVALCSMQSIVDTNECSVPLGLRVNYSVTLEQHALELRTLLDQVFEAEPG